MHPFFRSPRNLIWALVFWLPFCFGLAYLQHALTGNSLGKALLLVTPPMLFLLLLALSTWLICRFVPAIPKALPWAILTHLLGSLVMAAAGIFTLRLNAVLLDTLDHATGWISQEKKIRTLFFVLGAIIYFLAIFFNYLLMFMDKNRKAEKRLLQSELDHSRLELKALKATIHPHFLFNALTALSVLILHDPPRAREMCLHLADFLRFTMRMTQKRFILMAEEIQHLKNYLEVEHIRLGARLQVKWQIGEGVEKCLVPPMILQPLVENAIKHGIQHRLEGGDIRVKIDRRGMFLNLQVSNPLADEPEMGKPVGEGLGLATIRKRIQDEFGSRADLNATKEKDDFLVSVWLPVQMEEEGSKT